MMNHKLFSLLIIAMLTILAGCASTSTPATATPSVMTFSNEPTTIVLEQSHSPGFVMRIYAMTLTAPQLRLYGDGRMIYRALMDDGNKVEWRETKLTPAQIQTLLTDVLGKNNELCLAGEIPSPQVTDLGSTAITVNTNEVSCRVSVYAPSIKERGAMSAEIASKFAQFEHASDVLDQTSQTQGTPYKPDVVTLYRDEGANTNEVPIEWTYSEKPVEGALIKGAEASALLQQAALPTAFTYEGITFTAVAVPVLP